MLISPPFLDAKVDGETDAGWIRRIMPVESGRGYPVNQSGSWHGGIHITHPEQGSQSVRAISDGKVVSVRIPFTDSSLPEWQDPVTPPLNYNGVTHNGYVLLEHTTEIGEGNDAKVVFYSLYMHLKQVESRLVVGEKVFRKDVLGEPGMVDGSHAFHFQIFCDDANARKLTGRTTMQLDLTRNGRTDCVYGDIYFYLPSGVSFYEKAPATNTVNNTERVVYTSTTPLIVSMKFQKGDCIMTTHTADEYRMVGTELVNEDQGKDEDVKYEYELYKKANKLYPDSPSAGYELLRFGRVINTTNETLVPANAPLWRTVRYEGGQGVVNLAAAEVVKFSDADFPHWLGWKLVDDDPDSNSQCNSTFITCWRHDPDKVICHFPLEWEVSNVAERFSWLLSAQRVEQQNQILFPETSSETNAPYTPTVPPAPGRDTFPSFDFSENVLTWPTVKRAEELADDDWQALLRHIRAICFDTTGIIEGRVWHFEPRAFITQFRKCGWLSQKEIASLLPRTAVTQYPNPVRATINWEKAFNRWAEYYIPFNRCCNKYLIDGSVRKSHFLGQIYTETALVATMEEYGKGTPGPHAPAIAYYTAFYGRGAMQLTWPENFENYGKFQSISKLPDVAPTYTYSDSRITSTSLHYTTDPRKKDRQGHVYVDETMKKLWYPKYDPGLIASSSYFALDSAGFYWISKKHRDNRQQAWKMSINEVCDRGINSASIGRCSVLVNGGSYHYFERQGFVRYAYYYLSDDVKNVTEERIRVTKGNVTNDVIVNYSKQAEGV